jgi:hypothetical protein
MAAAIRVKLADLLSILMEKPPVAHEPQTRQIKMTTPLERRPLSVEVEKDLEAIKEYLLAGPARRSDLEFQFTLSNSAVLHRLHLLMERGVVVDLPGHMYGIPEGRR